MSLISVIIPVYNGAAFIARAVDSALAQDFSDFEVIVVDDGSTDATGLILSEYGDKIRVLRQENRGASVARNRGAAIAGGGYLAFLDADDWWRQDKLTLTHRALEGNEKAVLAFSGFHELLPDEIELGERRYQKAPSLEEILADFLFIGPSTVLMRRLVFERIGGFCEELGDAAYEDTYLWLLAREHGEFIYLDELLVTRRVRASYCEERWWLNKKTFQRLILARYGRLALPTIQHNDGTLADLALREVAIQLRLGNPVIALRWWIKAARLRPKKAIWRLARTIPRAAEGLGPIAWWKREVQRRSDLRSAREALLASETLPSEEKRLISRVPLRIHPNDDMYQPGAGRHYLSIGLSARRCIMAALAHTPQNPIRTILDLPSGYGRILRLLQLSFPNSTVWGCDIVPEAVYFCAKEFNVNILVSNTDFNKVSFPTKFDLIWSGSLLTHLGPKDATELLRLFYRSLSPTGVCVFTMHGQTSAAWFDSRAETYGLSETDVQKVLSDFADKGYGYADYPPNLGCYSGYGIALATRARIIQMASAVGDWNFLSFHERMWSDHHDVYAFSKGPTIAPLIAEARGPIPAPNLLRWVL